MPVGVVWFRVGGMVVAVSVASVGAVLHAVGPSLLVVTGYGLQVGIGSAKRRWKMAWMWVVQGPVGWEVQRSLSAASLQGGRGVEDLILQGFGFGSGEWAVAAE